LELCTQWLFSVGKDRIFIGLLGEMWKPHLYIVSWHLRTRQCGYTGVWWAGV